MVVLIQDVLPVLVVVSTKPTKDLNGNTMKRTNLQNRALHLFYTLLADALNNAGLDMKVVLRPSVSIPWTKESVKEHLWKPIQNALYGKVSTTELDKSQEIDRVHEVLMRHISEKFHLEYIDFPHEEKKSDLLEGMKIDIRNDPDYPQE